MIRLRLGHIRTICVTGMGELDDGVQPIRNICGPSMEIIWDKLWDKLVVHMWPWYMGIKFRVFKSTVTFTHNSLHTKTLKTLIKTHRKGMKLQTLLTRQVLVQGWISPKYGFLCVLIALLGSQGIVVKCNGGLPEDFYSRVFNFAIFLQSRKTRN